MQLTIKDSVLRFVLLKLTTDRHEASRGLFATAELPVSFGLSDSLSVLLRPNFGLIDR